VAAGAVALFVASVLTASLVAFFSSFLAGAGAAVVAGAEAVTAGAGVAGALTGSAAKAVTVINEAISVDTSFMEFSLV